MYFGDVAFSARAQEGSGRGHKVQGVGGPIVGKLSMAEALDNPAYLDFPEAMRVRLIDLVRDYMAIEVIDTSEFV